MVSGNDMQVGALARTYTVRARYPSAMLIFSHQLLRQAGRPVAEMSAQRGAGKKAGFDQ